MDFQEQKLHKLLIGLTKDFIHKDFMEYRKERNWSKYDSYTSTQRLAMIFREIKEHKDGYFEGDTYED